MTGTPFSGRSPYLCLSGTGHTGMHPSLDPQPPLSAASDIDSAQIATTCTPSWQPRWRLPGDIPRHGRDPHLWTVRLHATLVPAPRTGPPRWTPSRHDRPPLTTKTVGTCAFLRIHIRHPRGCPPYHTPLRHGRGAPLRQAH